MAVDLDLKTNETLVEMKLTKNHPCVRGGPYWLRIWVNDSLSFGHSCGSNATVMLDSAIKRLQEIKKDIESAEKKAAKIVANKEKLNGIK